MFFLFFFCNLVDASLLKFHFRSDMTGSYHVKITGRAVNLGDKKGQKVPCKVEIIGQEQYVNILERTLSSLLYPFSQFLVVCKSNTFPSQMLCLLINRDLPLPV